MVKFCVLSPAQDFFLATVGCTCSRQTFSERLTGKNQSGFLRHFVAFLATARHQKSQWLGASVSISKTPRGGRDDTGFVETLLKAVKKVSNKVSPIMFQDPTESRNL